MSWQNVGGTATNGSTYNNSMYIYNGIPYVAYEDDSNGYKISVVRFYNGIWEQVGGYVSTGSGDKPSIFVYNGTPYIAYYDSDASKLLVKVLNGSSWDVVGSNDVSANGGTDASLFDDNGTLYVSFTTYTTGGSLYTMKLTANTWGAVGGLPIASSGQFNNIQLFVSNGTPYLAYNTDTGSKLVYLFNGSWAYFGEYMKDFYKRNMIMTAYFKVRQHDFYSKMCFNLNRRQICWRMLEMIEPDMHLPFKAINGRNGMNFAQALPEYVLDPEPPKPMVLL
jgi:hypothetical protein